MPKQVSLPPVEATFEASRPFFTSAREAIETIQGLRAQPSLAPPVEMIPGIKRKITANTSSSTSTPVTVAGMVFPVKRGRSYQYRFHVAFRTKAGNLDLGVKIARPAGAHLGRVVVSDA